MLKKLFSVALLALTLFMPQCVHAVSISAPPPAVVTAYASTMFDLFDGIEADGSGDWSVGKKTSDTKTLNYEKAFTKYQNILQLLVGFILCSVFGSMIFRFYKLSVSGGNEMERKKAITGIMITGIVIALLGSFSIILGIVYHMFG